MAAVLTSAAGIISLLDEPHADLKHFALKKLNKIVNEFWPEISDSISKIELLHENENYPQDQRELAALVASKVYYHLGAFEESLKYALGAGTLFTGQLTRRDEYVETILAKCLDKYILLRTEAYPDEPADGVVDPNLESIVNQMFEQCFQDKQYKQALGIAIETRRMDMFRRAIPLSEEQEAEMLAYAFRVVMSLVSQRSFRDKLLKSLVGLYAGLKKPDNISRCQCLIFLDDHEEAAKLLVKLSRDEDDRLMAYQIGFDLYESATQNFLGKVLASLKQLVGQYLPDSSERSSSADEATESAEAGAKPGRSDASATDETRKHWEQLLKILSGEISIALQLQFLIRSNKTDLTILKQTKEVVRVSICHTGTVIANAFMHSGTTSDQFLRDNLDWLARATNWAKFTATASLGVIHRGHENEALSLMHSYLPREAGGSVTGYSEGGALFALGLIHANHGTNIIDYLIRQLTSPSLNEMIGHGACLGLGLAAMGTAKKEVYEILHSNLNKDDAVIGEAAGIGMGLVMLGSMDKDAIESMKSYAKETQHEKILRGLALGISLLTFGKLESADSLIEELLNDKDALLRRAGVLSVAMAYCGTASNSAIQKLLKVAVSDVNDDVRRAAVIGLGFLLFRASEQCPNVVSLLAESYNPHVRYGAALAIGIACAGSGNKEALALIEPLTQDPVNYVRQGALIASSMILIQQTEVLCPKVKDFRALYTKVLNDKHDDVMAKFGAILAQGIIDGGGRNVTVTLSSRTGHVWLQGAVGMLLFTHYWYWFPMSLCLGLSFTPSYMVAVNKHLQMPVLQFKSNAKPSTFAYPPPLEERKKEERERVATAILSVTAKAKKREAEKAKAVGTAATEEEKEKEKPKVSAEEKMETDEKPEDKKEKEKEKEVKKEEPLFEMLANPARVMKQQLRYMELPDEKDGNGESLQRWEAVKELSSGGIIVVRDKKSTEPVDVVLNVAAHGPPVEDEENEPEPPEEFEYDDAKD